MRSAFVHEETVRWSDADLQGVLNNAVYLTLFEQARFGYFGALGVLEGDRFPFLLGSTAVRFERPARAGDRLRIEARVTRLGTKSFDMAYVVRRGDQQIATGVATLVWVDGSNASTAIPDAVRAAVAAREGIAERAAE